MASSTGKPSRVTRMRLSSAFRPCHRARKSCAGGGRSSVRPESLVKRRGRCPRAAAGPSAGTRRPRSSGVSRRSSSTTPWPSRLDPRRASVSGSRSVAVARRPVPVDQPAMRAGADAGIFAVAPIDEVVPAFRAGPGVVGDLVGRQAVLRRRSPASCRTARAPRRRPARRACRLVQALEHGAGLDGELVERQMLGRRGRAPASSSAAQASGVWPGRA